jgi:uncharacterized protein YqgV (UPF0045/DUF77 family)
MLSDGAVDPMATEEVAATQEPGGGPPRAPDGPDERVSVSLLILQRVDHLEQRLERLEDKMDARFTALEAKMDERFAAVDARFAALEAKMDERFAAVDARFAATDAKIDDLRRELSAKIDTQSRKIDGQTAKMIWLFGLILVAVIAKVFIPHL